MADQNPNLDEFLGAKQQPKWRRWVKWGVVAAAVIALLLLLSRCFAGPAEVQYATQPVERGNLRVTVSATGKLAPTNQVQVGSELSGLITRVVVDVNDRVAAGQPLALIDPSQLDDEIRQGQAQLNANIAQVAQANATVQESRAQLARFEEVSRLSAGRVPAKIEMDQARAGLARALANLRTAQAQVVASRAQLNSSQTRRAKAIVRSPVNGVVLARQVEPGQTVAASFNTPTLFVIAEDLATMELQVAIDEADVGTVKDGQRATFTVDAFPGQTFPARIIRVDLGSNLSAQTSTTTSSTTQAQVVSYAAVLAVSNPEQQLRPGMTATAEIVTTERTNVLMVPNAALRFNPATAGQQAQGGITGALVPRGRRGQQAARTATIGRGAQETIYVLGEDGKPRPIQVTVGDTNGSMTEVTGGELRPGMQVITGQLAADGSGGSSGERRRQGGGQGGTGAGGQRGNQ